MCQFLSWVEHRESVLYLNYHHIYETKKGKELREHIDNADLLGHGAIRYYYGIAEGNREAVNRECINFSTPATFPPQIVAAIKSGEFRGLRAPEGLLSSSALAEYERVMKNALAEYERVMEPSEAEYDRVTQAAWAECKRVMHLPLAEYNRARRPAEAAYERVRQDALAEYNRARRPAWVEYDRTDQATFWDLFANPANRADAWRSHETAVPPPQQWPHYIQCPNCGHLLTLPGPGLYQCPVCRSETQVLFTNSITTDGRAAHE